jgi:hypothetical protein
VRIGLLGAPGAGKSKLAKRLKKELEARFQTETYPIVDNYVSKLAKQTGRAYGHWANYVDNLNVGFKRYELEVNAGDNLITCGTILDTITYGFSIADLDVQRNAQRRTMAINIATLNALMKTQGWLFTQMFAYDVAFYLPVTNSEGHPPRQDAALRTTIDEFFAAIVPLEEGKIDRQVKRALSVIAALDEPVETAPVKEQGF